MTKLYTFDGLHRVEVDTVAAGDICALAGFDTLDGVRHAIDSMLFQDRALIQAIDAFGADGWPAGNYKLTILVNGQEVESEDFEIGG